MSITIFRRFQDVLHEHSYRHGAYSAGDRGDPASNGGGFVEIHVADNAVALFGAIGNAVYANIDDSRALFYHIAADKARFARCRDKNISLPGVRWQVGGSGVAKGNRGVQVALGKHRRKGLAHNVGTAHYHNVLA